MNKANLDLQNVSGLKWIANGQTNLSGPVLRLYQALETFFLGLARETDAVEYQFPAFIRVAELKKLDYFRSFPHLVTLPVTLSMDNDNIRRFIDNGMLNEKSELQLTETAPICDCLTPAACYHFYIHHQGEQLSHARYMTTCASCWRREVEYQPLRRQWNFRMREIVCLGSADEVKTHLSRYRNRLTDVFSALGWPISWDIATDPFFDPTRNAKFIMQQLDPVKTEMIYNDGSPTGLSIGSLNYHRNYFGEAFQIRRGTEEAFSGCVAFGMERWIFAILNEYGPSEKDWAPFLHILSSVADRKVELK